jgi:hypothetical protein
MRKTEGGTPLVSGGQGRTEEGLDDAARMVLWSWLGCLGLLTALFLFAALIRR